MTKFDKREILQTLRLVRKYSTEKVSGEKNLKFVWLNHVVIANDKRFIILSLLISHRYRDVKTHDKMEYGVIGSLTSYYKK